MEKLTFLGKIVILFFFGLMIILMIILLLFQSNQPTHTKEKGASLSFKECPPTENGIQFLENQTIFYKDVFFCVEIVSKEHIPAKTMIRFSNGATIMPLEETATKAIYGVRFRELFADKWHIVATD